MPHQTNNKSEKRYSFFKQAVSSLTAGTFIAYLTFPAEALKKLKQNTGLGLKDLYIKQKQADGLSDYQTIKKALRTGILGSTQDGQPYRFYRGSSIFALNIIPTTFIQLFVERKLEKLYPKENASIGENIIKSVASGIAGASTATVVENCIVRQQELKKDKLKDGLQDIYQNRGLSGFWKSYPLIATRDGIFTFCMFWANPEVQKYVTQNYPGKTNELAAALLVGSMGATISHPVDVIGARMQRTHEPMTTREAYHDVIKTFNTQGFLKGLSYRIFLFTAFSQLIPRFEKEAGNMLDKHAKPLLLSTQSQAITGKDAVVASPTESKPEVKAESKVSFK